MEKFEKIINESLKLENFKTFDVHQEWMTFADKISNNKSENNFKKENFKIIKFVLSAAAIFFVLAVVLPVFKNFQPSDSTLIAQNDSQELLLVDGSNVRLEQGAQATYFMKLTGVNERRLVLNGRAQIDVSKSILPFRVYLNDLVIEVLGTSFIVDTHNEEKTEIFLIEGSLKAFEQNDPSNFIIMKGGDRLVFQYGTFFDFEGDKIMDSEVSSEMENDESKSGRLHHNEKKAMGSVDSDEEIFRQYTLESVIKNHLLRYNKGKIKLGKRIKLDYNHIVPIDDVNKKPELLLEDLKKMGYIDYIQGDCNDCFIIIAPTK